MFNLLPENRAVYEITWGKYDRARQATDGHRLRKDVVCVMDD
jgi:hypothetical protein